MGDSVLCIHSRNHELKSRYIQSLGCFSFGSKWLWNGHLLAELPVRASASVDRVFVFLAPLHLASMRVAVSDLVGGVLCVHPLNQVSQKTLRCFSFGLKWILKWLRDEWGVSLRFLWFNVRIIFLLCGSCLFFLWRYFEIFRDTFALPFSHVHVKSIYLCRSMLHNFAEWFCIFLRQESYLWFPKTKRTSKICHWCVQTR